jgi:predicted adenylyl cyclase CyaB
MSLNIEIKARCEHPEAVSESLRELAARYEGEDEQTDIFYKTPAGRLKLRRSKLYGCLLIPYLRADQAQAKSSQYALLKVDDPEQLDRLMTRIFGVEKIVHKFRRIFHYENVRVHLDEVEQLGNFIELEAVVRDESEIPLSHQRIDFLMQRLQILPQDLIAVAYADMLL